MAVSYKKLWKLLIDRDMKKKALCAKAGISPSSLTKWERTAMLPRKCWQKSVVHWTALWMISWIFYQRTKSVSLRR